MAAKRAPNTMDLFTTPERPFQIFCKIYLPGQHFGEEILCISLILATGNSDVKAFRQIADP